MLERDFKKSVKDEIKKLFPDSIILQNDPTCIQGIPDMLILFKNMWASLEFKKNKQSKHRPNQDYYVEKMNNMSFSSFIFPENRDDVINKLKEFFKI